MNNTCDWSDATNEEIKDLYQVIRSLEKTRGITMDVAFQRANKKKVALSPHLRGNFRRGELSKKLAKPLFEWVVENHLKLATEVAANTFDPSMLTPWMNFLENHLQYGALNARIFNQRGLTTRSEGLPIAEPTLRLSKDDYYFVLKSKIAGSLLAFEGYEGDWYPMGLHHDRDSKLTTVNVGMNELPTKADDVTIDPLRDDESPGLHRFVFIIAPERVLEKHQDDLIIGKAAQLESLDKLAYALEELDQENYAVHGINVLFSA
ncbi:MAG: hypothetical protein JJ891_16230 [Rhizobiaceae bacterium]|jgi:hypothetical protein|nr:hypothetical protein [Rhizobiaceae bacterium]